MIAAVGGKSEIVQPFCSAKCVHNVLNFAVQSVCIML